MIESALLSQVAEFEKSALSNDEVAFDSISIDTRSLKPGDLFVAIRGESFDGHNYIGQAEQAGCCGVIVESAVSCSTPCLVLNNTTHALGTIGGINRAAFKGTVFGLTGSSGKTTTKNMLATILNLKAPTCATEGNFNNEIGVPLTLLSISKEHRFAVIEMGARTIGDINYLAQFVKPDVAILLNAGVAHIDVFGSYENIVRTKGEIYGALGEEGIAVVNADDSAAELWLEQLHGKTVYGFSLSGLPFSNKGPNTLRKIKHKLWAENIVCRAESSTFTLHFDDESQSVKLSAPGMHNISNSLAAAAAALAVGISLKLVAKGLESIKSTAGRLNTIALNHDLALIDDSYNANPNSMKAALDVLALYDGLTVAVLGEMAELGVMSERLHSELAEYAAKSSISAFYFVGEHAVVMQQIVGARAQSFKTNTLLAEQLIKDLESGETVLVKGSRSAAMDEVVELLTRRAQ